MERNSKLSYGLLSLACLVVGCLLLSNLTGCKHDQAAYANPTIYRHKTLVEAKLSATAEARDIAGVHYQCIGTASMEPLIVGQAYVVCEWTPFSALKVGDIINYLPAWNYGRLTVHRIVAIDRGGLIMSGDNNRWSESWERVTADNYVNRVVSIHAWDGIENTRVRWRH